MVYWALSVSGCGSDATFMVDWALSVFACGPDVTYMVDRALSVSTVSADLPVCLHPYPVCFSLCEVILHRFPIIKDQLIGF